MRQKNPVVHSPLAITQLVWLPGTWRRMRKGVTLALESNTVSSAPTSRPADMTSKQRVTHTVFLRVSERNAERTVYGGSEGLHGRQRHQLVVVGQSLNGLSVVGLTEG